MKRLVPIFLMVFGFVSCQNSPNNKIDLNQISEIDLSNPKDFEILKIDDFNGMPSQDGILKSYSVKFPEFEKAIYFGSDGKGRSGIIPSNRGYMWILDNEFNLISDPIIRKSAGTFGGNPTKEGTYTILQLKNGTYLAILPLVGEYSMGYFRYLPNKLPEYHIASFGTAQVEAEVPVLAYATGNTIYEASQKVWTNVIKSDLKGVTAKLRSEKEFPEYWKYLGWCSWEEYRYKISEDLISESMKKINKSEVPIRWVLIDEGPQWYQDPEGQGKNRFKLGLYSFDPDPEKFPNGLTPLLKYKSEDKIKWMGIWQHEAGLYRGIAPNNIMGSDMNTYFEKLPNGQLMAKGNFDSQYKFFEGLFSYTKKAGFDFVKVDFQGPQFNSYVGSDNAVYAHIQSNRALEAITKDNNWGLLNCFANDLTWAFNSSHSMATRASQDYRKGKPSAARIQTYQCYNNKIWMGNVVWGDHDMFHSNDAMADRMMAVSKALAGAPIYVSDAPEDFVPEVITPLCYEDGELIRPLAPATALPESFFLDPLYAKNMYRVIAPLSNGAASVVCYNIYDGDDNEDNSVTIKGKVSAKDYPHASAMIQPYPGEWSIPKDGLIAFDAYNKKVYNLNEGDVEVSLTGLEDRLFHLCPVSNGWSIIGLTEKHLSPATVISPKYASDKVSFQVKQKGEVAIYLEKGEPTATDLSFKKGDNGLWLVNIPENMVNGNIIISKKL